uniref:Uncharacterized protein n=1 Tax=Knipowitschia caucasica TaxID=637954 RepID=A0AAV2IWN6_KNICA
MAPLCTLSPWPSQGRPSRGHRSCVLCNVKGQRLVLPVRTPPDGHRGLAPLAGPGLLPWHCHGARPAHLQLPTGPERTAQPQVHLGLWKSSGMQSAATELLHRAMSRKNH